MIFRRLLPVLLLSSLFGLAQAQSVDVAGIKLEPRVQVQENSLQLNGAGIRTRAIFKVYVAALYVPAPARTASALLEQKGARRLSITMLRSVGADTFAQALEEGLRANHSAAQLDAIKPQFETLNAQLKLLGEAKKGDVIYLDFKPELGTQLVVNGVARGPALNGDEFFTALLRIWLGDKPVDGDLKKALIGA